MNALNNKRGAYSPMALLALACFAVPSIGGQGANPAQDIADHIVATLLPGVSASDHLSPHVFVSARPLSVGDEVVFGDFSADQSWFASGGEYLAWVDDNPGARFEHPSRIIIASISGAVVSIDQILNTSLPVILNNALVWYESADAMGPDRYFPDITGWDVDDVDVGFGFPSFTNSGNASSLFINGNSEESSAKDSVGQVQSMLDDMGIPVNNQDSLDLPGDNTTPTGTAFETLLSDRIKAAGLKGNGPEFVLVISAHGFAGKPPLHNGGIAIVSGEKARALITYDDLLCLICDALKGTNKRKVQIVLSSCHAEWACCALTALTCSDCKGFEFGIAAACKKAELSYSSNYIPFVGRPWDFLEELEDEDWSADTDLFELAMSLTEEAAEDIDNDNQNPTFGSRVIAAASAVVRNGTGINPNVYQNVSLPILGESWSATINSGAIGGGGIDFVFGYGGPLQLQILFGELLLDPTSGYFFTSVGFAVAGISTHTVPIPIDSSLIGFPVYTQGYVNLAGALTNAIDLVVGL